MRPVLVALLLLVPTTSAAVPLLAPQNDAGSGGDAGNDAGSALHVPLGRHVGQLATVPLSKVRDPLLDGSDWYAVDLEAGRRTTLVLQNLGGDSKHVEIRRPDGTFAGSTLAWSSGGHRVDVPADVGGTWLIHVQSPFGKGGAYAFAVDQGPPEPFVAFSGSGWLAATFDVAPGAPFRGIAKTSYVYGNGPSRVDAFLVREDGSLVSTFPPWPGGETDSLAVAAADVGVEVDVRTYASSWASAEIQYNVTTPGRYHLVMIVAANDIFTHLVNATGPVATAHGSNIVAWRPTDMDPVAAVSAAPAEATLGASADLRVSHRLVGAYICDWPGAGVCTVTAPGGASTPTTRGVWGNGAPGVWTFTRDRAGVSTYGGYVLLAADVPMPTLG